MVRRIRKENYSKVNATVEDEYGNDIPTSFSGKKIGFKSTYNGSKSQRRYADYTLYKTPNGYVVLGDFYSAWSEIPDRHFMFSGNTKTDVYKKMQSHPINQLIYDNGDVRNMLND